ncbi:MAG: hypothetical protein QOJ11_2766 [Frankiales bacterium]|jgi:dihydroxy-acid dehydratase|nr:hypothetical protein [Frankiales bacterium]
MSQRSVIRQSGAALSDEGPDGLIARAFLRGAGWSGDMVRRRPVIGIANSWSELNPCNAGLRDLAEAVKRGVLAAGGLPLEFPTISIAEAFVRPSSLYLRNLMAMDVEEMIRCSPVDGVVLLGGCDKTLPAQIMGALSAGKPAITVAAGPRPVSSWKGRPLTIDDLWPLIDQRTAGQMDDADWATLESCLNCDIGTCNVMGTATTMAAVAEVMGMALPGSSLLPAVSSARTALAEETGTRAVALATSGRRPDQIVSLQALKNAFHVVCAVGGSTNALVHLEAFAGRLGHRLGISRLDEWSRQTPWVADVRPAGHFQLADLQEAGGVPAVMRELAQVVDLSASAGDGRTWADVVKDTPMVAHPAIRSDETVPIFGAGFGLLQGTLAPRGALLKRAGADPRLLVHRGRAVVFDGVEDMHARIDDPALEIDADSVLVLRGMGPTGGPGMPEVGHLPIPKRLRLAGVTDMVRVSDARMSGTAIGTIVLHVTPEAHAGGPLGLVRNGDVIALDAEAGRLDLLVDPADLRGRGPASAVDRVRLRGYEALYQEHTLQADEGCDFDFLLGLPVECEALNV